MSRSFLLLAVLFLSIHYSEPALAQNVQPAARQLYEEGLALVEARQFAQAAENFNQALVFDPQFADAYAALGRTYFKMREWQKAVDYLRRAAALKSKRADAGNSVAAPRNTANTHAPFEVYKRYTLSRRTAEIVSSNETTATIKLRSLRLQEPEPAPEQTESLASAAPAADTPTAEAIPDPRVEETLTKTYRVGPNDVLDVRLNVGPEEQSTVYTVTAAGQLEHPLFSEPMPVAGLTVEEIGSRIEADLRKRAIAEDAKALVGVKDYASHPVLVSGLVKDSGTKFLRREAIPLYVVVAEAHALPEAAKVTVVRDGDRKQIYEIDLDQAVDMNFLVRSGDVITLGPNATQFVYIEGEIKFPGEKTFRRGLTLMQVILASGGLPPKAKTAKISRNNDEGYLVASRFKLEEIVSGKIVDPVLEPGDRISILR